MSKPVPKKEIVKKICCRCGQLKVVYGHYERDYESVDDLPDEELLWEGKRKTLDDIDIVGLPLCKECFEMDDDE